MPCNNASWKKLFESSAYNYYSTYFYVLDGYRDAIVAACKQDFDSLMQRLNEVEGGFMPPKTKN